MKQAILAAEDERFYQHGGIDTLGMLRAAIMNLTSGGKKQGASTITQQVARNFFLSSEKTYTRKLYEVLLSFKIEHNLTKDQILELYVNQIYLGQRAYGFAAAASIYFGKPLKDSDGRRGRNARRTAEGAFGVQSGGQSKRAKLRQQYVLRRMKEMGALDEKQHEAALKQTLVVKRETNDYAVHAEHVAEMARQMAADRFPEDVYSRGLRVFTTITRADQAAAYAALPPRRLRLRPSPRLPRRRKLRRPQGRQVRPGRGPRRNPRRHLRRRGPPRPSCSPPTRRRSRPTARAAT